MRALISVYRSVRLTARALVKRAITCSCAHNSAIKRRMSEGSASQRSKELPYSKSCTSQKEPISKACGIQGEITSALQEVSETPIQGVNIAAREPVQGAQYVKDEDGGSEKSIEKGKYEPKCIDNDQPEADKISESISESVPEIGVIKFNPVSKKWSTGVVIPKEMRRYVIGAKGRRKRKLEEETDCRLIFPSRRKKMRPINIVSSKSQECVELCRDRIESLIVETRKRASYTHFVSLPMNHADIQTAFTQFAELVQNDDELPASCREPAVFQEAGKLHLTVVMLSLLDENEKTKAANALEAVVNNRAKKIVDGVPMEVELRGLEYMNDDPTRVRVLYAKAYSEKLQEVANVIADGIGDAGLAPRRSERVKVHCTLMNTRYAIEKGKENDAMDVEKLMQKYGEFFFGHVSVSEVHLSSRVDPKDENGFYACVASFKLC
uniref:Activating signal cointegrator 1 complex subunit 1 n=1 Tax=Ascaris suum TaxID=6253 RepID=F1KX24_ASCSU